MTVVELKGQYMSQVESLFYFSIRYRGPEKTKGSEGEKNRSGARGTVSTDVYCG